MQYNYEETHCKKMQWQNGHKTGQWRPEHTQHQSEWLDSCVSDVFVQRHIHTQLTENQTDCLGKRNSLFNWKKSDCDSKMFDVSSTTDNIG